ncbi:hypothetical protein RHSIM_Rhsim12G0138900 [Rhododendron simsii]|uniref:Golgin candidate 2 n=1 Tax=Rhododendron simsii TaxID=118357 RepID=A0A834L991_RHOSS|nr:hypothetical protein RHSIM_Rhsim12G0138900 [Rhododendron simsii]
MRPQCRSKQRPSTALPWPAGSPPKSKSPRPSYNRQIDQQAAESLGKIEKSQSDELSSENPRRSTEVVPLKDQLKKKNKDVAETSDLIGKIRSDRNSNETSNGSKRGSGEDVGALVVNVVKPSVSPPKSGLTDSDWTELLSVPSQATSASRSNGVSGIRGIRKDGRRKGVSGSNLSGLEVKRNQKGQNTGLRASPKSGVLLVNKVNGGRISDGEESKVADRMQRNSRVKSGSEDNYAEGRELDGKERSPSLVGMEKNEANEERNSVSETLADKDSLVGRVGDGVSDLKIGKGDDHSRVRSSFGGIDKKTVGPRSHSSMKKGSSTFTPSSLSDGGSASETDSTSSSDSEIEREKEERRRRKAQILAEKAAAKALEAIKERENMVARLEGEKQSLEKILEERANQQAQEASELQNSMMETMEAVELEKQKHNSTRMEALGRMAKLEIANADLARSLAAAQWKVEVEMNQLAELRQQVEVKEATHEELRRKISVAHDTGNQLVASKGIEFEREILESEISFVIEKIGRLQEKAKTLESNIEMTRQELENPTEVEVELRRRLGQLTDHLIQKQAQVEALSSEKATYVLRIEAVSRLLDENKSTLNAVDVESGIWEFSNSKLRPLFEERIQSGRKHLGSLVQQLDSIFCAGAIFLRRNSTARLWSLVYLVCLHFWVVYILLSHSPVSEEAKSGAVFSLEIINNTGGG